MATPSQIVTALRAKGDAVVAKVKAQPNLLKAYGLDKTGVDEVLAALNSGASTQAEAPSPADPNPLTAKWIEIPAVRKDMWDGVKPDLRLNDALVVGSHGFEVRRAILERYLPDLDSGRVGALADYFGGGSRQDGTKRYPFSEFHPGSQAMEGLLLDFRKSKQEEDQLVALGVRKPRSHTVREGSRGGSFRSQPSHRDPRPPRK